MLTAAHCAGSGMVFKTGNDASSFVSHVVDQQIAHPTLDLLVAHLSAPIGGVPLIPINEGALPAVGEVCTAIGFGRHETGGVTTSGTKRSATEQVTAASSSQIVVQLVTGIADHGDSGGPLVCQGRIAAVVHGHSDGDWPTHMVFQDHSSAPCRSTRHHGCSRAPGSPGAAARPATRGRGRSSGSRSRSSPWGCRCGARGRMRRRRAPVRTCPRAGSRRGTSGTPSPGACGGSCTR
ncbi:trypsin-like serine protease [Sorangium sp. So ce887]|uniref:trypsin-like serine protease n=1 Tax=Sorangium sp. So ce887 TaxID=3133324 RepID=UPI003F60495B